MTCGDGPDMKITTKSTDGLTGLCVIIIRPRVGDGLVCKWYHVVVRELTFETLPPPGEFRRPIFPKTLYPQLFRSACLHLYRGCVCPGGPIEGRYLPLFRGGGDIF